MMFCPFLSTRFLPGFNEVPIARSLVLCSVLYTGTIACFLSFFLMIIALSVLRFTASDYTFGIFKPFSLLTCELYFDGCHYLNRICPPFRGTLVLNCQICSKMDNLEYRKLYQKTSIL